MSAASPSDLDEARRLHASFPNMTISATMRFGTKTLLQSPSCLQVTDTALWFTWDHNGLGRGFVDLEFDGAVARRTSMLHIVVVHIEN
jgi:hypothetical protein